jgi:hypothetical protein
MKSRLHLYPHSEPQGTAYIVGERSALRALGETLIAASQSVVGFEIVELYTSDGHSYTVTVISSVTEEEWQTVDTPYIPAPVPRLQIIQDYDAVKSEISNKS